MAKLPKQKAAEYKKRRTDAGLTRRDYYGLPETHEKMKKLEKEDLKKVGL